MPLHSADMLEETPATQFESAPIASNQPDSLALDETLPDLSGDTIQLLLQSPHKLFLYWNLAIDPATTLREAFGELAARYRLMVRLVKVESGEEFLLEAMPERRQWFEVYPHHTYRADVGFYAENRPFVRLLSSDVVQTPSNNISQTLDDAAEFQLEVEEFARHLRGTAYERYARSLAGETAELSSEGQAAHTGHAESLAAGAQDAHREANEYPHR